VKILGSLYWTKGKRTTIHTGQGNEPISSVKGVGLYIHHQWLQDPVLLSDLNRHLIHRI
jgi:hypothetical protein